MVFVVLQTLIPGNSLCRLLTEQKHVQVQSNGKDDFIANIFPQGLPNALFERLALHAIEWGRSARTRFRMRPCLQPRFKPAYCADVRRYVKTCPGSLDFDIPKRYRRDENQSMFSGNR